jgi:hypothetical protein
MGLEKANWKNGIACLAQGNWFCAIMMPGESTFGLCRTSKMSHGAGWREPCASTDRDRR